MIRRNQRRPGERGAAAVEFALILPLFMFLVLGCIDWGYYFFIDQIVTNAAREGARVGSLKTDSVEAAETAELIAEQYLENVGKENDDAVTASAPVGDPPGVEVVIDFPVGSITGFLGSIMPENASARAIMRIEP